jgi:hypothetical protein
MAAVLIAAAALILSVLLVEAVAQQLAAPVYSRHAQFRSTPADEWSDPNWRAPPRRVLRSDPVLGYEHEPHASAFVNVAEHPARGYRFATNGLGLRRDDEVAIPKPDGVFRVLILGDSQTEGYASNVEHYPHHLEQILRAQSGERQIEALNAGVLGYSPQQSYLWYRERGAELDPDLVVLSLYAGNDLLDMIAPTIPPAVVEADAGRLWPWTAPDDWLHLHSRPYQLGRLAVMQGPLADPLTRFGLLDSPDRPHPERVLEFVKDCHGCWGQHLHQASVGLALPARAERELGRLETLFGVLARQVAADGGRLVVVVIPTKAQVEPADERGAINRAARLLELTDEHLRFSDRVHQRMLDAAARAGVAAIDPLPRLVEAAGSGRLYYRRDWHLNPNGNRVLGAILAEALVEQGLAAPRR